MNKVLELIEQIRFAELEKIATLSKAQENYMNARNSTNLESSD